METRIVKVALNIEFERENPAHKQEFDSLSQDNSDPISMWLKNARARGKIIDENEPIIELLIQLHRKMDALESAIKCEPKRLLALESSAKLSAIGHDLIIFEQEILEIDAKYYGRMNLAVFPKREIPLFFRALDSKKAEIYLMHNRDTSDFDAYITARERSIIRENKNK